MCGSESWLAQSFVLGAGEKGVEKTIKNRKRNLPKTAS